MNPLEDLKEIVETGRYALNHTYFSKLISKLIETNKISDFNVLLEKFLKNAPPSFYESHLSLVILSAYEKYLDKEKALALAKKIIYSKKKQSYAFASMLRICRRKNNYEELEQLFEEEPELKNLNSFEVLYELTYYYNSKNDLFEIDKILGQLISLYKNSTPIIKTATSLSIRYGLYEKYASQLNSQPISLRRYDSNKDTEQVIKDIEEEEYERIVRSAALADLTNGIAHEFGQPLTNIRFGIQYYTRIFENKNELAIEKKDVFAVFKDILTQTERIGRLIDRLTPITSRKAVASEFNLLEAVQLIFEQEKTKIESNHIKLSHLLLKHSSTPLIIFDFTQFNQIVSNLLNNSIDSIIEKKRLEPEASGFIRLTIKEINDKYLLEFVDSGIGIPSEAIDRIFNPFYTTKPPDKGQGLGLYIVSNLLKMNGGTISIDRKYTKGAKFRISLPKNNSI